MKRVLLISICSLFFTISAGAVSLPPFQTGAFYSFKSHSVNTLSTFEVVKIKDLIAMETGIAGDADKVDWEGVVALSLDIKQLHLGNYVTLPILNLIEFRPALVAGMGHINGKDLAGARFDWGLGATVVNIKW